MPSGLSLLGVGGASASSSLNPDQVAGLQGWWKADSESYVNNDPVATFTDRSGNTRNLTGAGTARPTFKTNIVNGLPALLFNHSTNRLVSAGALSNFITAALWTVYVVASVTSIGTNAADSAAYSNEPLVCDPGGFWGMHLASSGPALQAFEWNGSAKVAHLVIATATWTIFEYRHEAGTLYVNKNGSGEVSAAGGNCDNITNVLNMGANNAVFLDGYIAESAFYNVAASASDRQKLRAGLGAKYGITVS